jgi:hypothetical protein
MPEYADTLNYSPENKSFADFGEWLDNLVSSDEFRNRCAKYIDIYKRLKTETDKEMRHYLVRQAYQLQQSL